MDEAPPTILSLTERFSWVLANELHAGHLRIVVADKLHNADCTLAELGQTDPSVWTRFKTGRNGTLWYLSDIHKLLESRLLNASTKQLGLLIRNLHNPHQPIAPLTL